MTPAVRNTAETVEQQGSKADLTPCRLPAREQPAEAAFAVFIRFLLPPPALASSLFFPSTLACADDLVSLRSKFSGQLRGSMRHAVEFPIKLISVPSTPLSSSLSGHTASLSRRSLDEIRRSTQSAHCFVCGTMIPPHVPPVAMIEQEIPPINTPLT